MTDGTSEPQVKGARQIWRSSHLGGWRTDSPRKTGWGEGFVSCLRKPMRQGWGYRQDASVKFSVWDTCIQQEQTRGLGCEVSDCQRIHLTDAMNLPAGTVLWFPPGAS
mgnify:FL=1